MEFISEVTIIDCRHYFEEIGYKEGTIYWCKICGCLKKYHVVTSNKVIPFYNFPENILKPCKQQLE